MNWKTTLGQVAVVVVGVLAANPVPPLLTRGGVAAPSAASLIVHPLTSHI